MKPAKRLGNWITTGRFADSCPKCDNYPVIEDDYLCQTCRYGTLPKIEYAPGKYGNEWTDSWSSDRTVAKDNINGYLISTVYLGVEHGTDTMSGKPLIYETMVFEKGNSMDKYCQRYDSPEAAKRGHKSICLGVEKGFIP